MCICTVYLSTLTPKPNMKKPKPNMKKLKMRVVYLIRHLLYAWYSSGIRMYIYEHLECLPATVNGAQPAGHPLDEMRRVLVGPINYFLGVSTPFSYETTE